MSGQVPGLGSGCDDVEEKVKDHNTELTTQVLPRLSEGADKRWQLRSTLQRRKREGRIFLLH